MNCIKSIRQTDATNHGAFISEPSEQTGRFVLYKDTKSHIVLMNNIKVRLKTDHNSQSNGQSYIRSNKEKNRRRLKTEQNKQFQQEISGNRSIQVHNFQPFNMSQLRKNKSINHRRQGSLQIQRKKLEQALKNRNAAFFSNVCSKQLLQKKNNPRLLNLGMINNSYIFLSQQQAKANMSLNIHPIHKKQLKKAMIGSQSDNKDVLKFPKLNINKSGLLYSKNH